MRLEIDSLSAFFVSAALLAGTGVPSRTLEPLGAPLRLAGVLAEVSGLAPAGAASVYAHNDEQATIHEIDIRSGRSMRSVSLGRPPLVGDFEAISRIGDRLALILSNGRIYETTIDPHRRSLAFTTNDAGVGADCEVEGFAAVGDGYVVACKRSKGRLVIYRWTKGAGAQKIIDMSLKNVVPSPEKFRAADLAADPATGTLLVLDSGAGAILEVSTKGEPTGYWRLGGDHPQAEGLALLADGRLIVADEGKIGGGKISRGTLTVYPPRR